MRGLTPTPRLDPRSSTTGTGDLRVPVTHLSGPKVPSSEVGTQPSPHTTLGVSDRKPVGEGCGRGAGGDVGRGEGGVRGGGGVREGTASSSRNSTDPGVDPCPPTRVVPRPRIPRYVTTDVTGVTIPPPRWRLFCLLKPIRTSGPLNPNCDPPCRTKAFLTLVETLDEGPDKCRRSGRRTHSPHPSVFAGVLSSPCRTPRLTPPVERRNPGVIGSGVLADFRRLRVPSPSGGGGPWGRHTRRLCVRVGVCTRAGARRRRGER